MHKCNCLSIQRSQKIALGIEYNGNRYHGWQKQQGNISVQKCLEQALSKVADAPIRVLCAGRTDSGVHATGQVVHFETNIQRKNLAWTMGTNRYLPRDISVRWMRNVAHDFHARFSATARRYRYIIYNYPNRPALLHEGVTYFSNALDANLMHIAAQVLLGEQDFTSFRSAQCQSHTPWRNVKHVRVKRQGTYIIVDIKANAFVHRMVRNIVGSLIEIGCGNRDKNWLSELLFLKDRKIAAATARSEGLYLVSVDYPERFALPSAPIGPLFLPDD